MNERQASSLAARLFPAAGAVLPARLGLLALMGACALAGCGQKGPLFLPAGSSATAKPAPRPASAPEAAAPLR